MLHVFLREPSSPATRVVDLPYEEPKMIAISRRSLAHGKLFTLLPNILGAARLSERPVMTQGHQVATNEAWLCLDPASPAKI